MLSNKEIIEKTGFSSRYISETIASFEQALMRKLIELDKNRHGKIKANTLWIGFFASITHKPDNTETKARK